MVILGLRRGEATLRGVLVGNQSTFVSGMVYGVDGGWVLVLYLRTKASRTEVEGN
jgi:hypothetical protein